jgi:MoaA/NifB/PqqE/SkfB family radical SAM enzyme
MRGNLAELPALVRLTHEHGADALVVQQLPDFVESNALAAGRNRVVKFVESEALRDDDLERVERHFGEARALAQALGVALKLPRIVPQPAAPAQEDAPAPAQSGRCSWPWRGTYIAFSGESKPCAAAAGAAGIGLGNAIREGVVKVWQSDAYRRFRDQLASGEPLEICRVCPVYRGTADDATAPARTP